MPNLAETMRRLRSASAGGLPGGLPTFGPNQSSRLQRLSDFGSNPGALAGWHYVPDATRLLALVVVLHGCTQNAIGYDYGSGWSELAQRFGFAVLFPEQQRINNPNLCFNWFQQEDICRGSGEALSIKQMIEAMASRYPIDADRVFVTGLSAGGAMANVMLATYPEQFAGGSIIAGLPYGTASSVPEALDRMRGNGHASAAAAVDTVRRASQHHGKWPTITVWHGDADRTVVNTNAQAILDQWRGVHRVDTVPDLIETVDGQQHRIWLDDESNVVVEEYVIAGLGHGTPLNTAGRDGCGHAGAYMLEAGISSTYRQAQNWKLIDQTRNTVAPASVLPPDAEPVAISADITSRVTATIEGALRSAGLMR